MRLHPTLNVGCLKAYLLAIFPYEPSPLFRVDSMYDISYNDADVDWYQVLHETVQAHFDRLYRKQQSEDGFDAPPIPAAPAESFRQRIAAAARS
uniref:Uncharacterized protein n=1 Tax=Peronospora matthiolae TaxID=2874970 RepID=A0AAV1T1I5_9STRA